LLKQRRRPQAICKSISRVSRNDLDDNHDTSL